MTLPRFPRHASSEAYGSGEKNEVIRAPFPSQSPSEAGGLTERQPKVIRLLAQDPSALESDLRPWMAQADIDEGVDHVPVEGATSVA